MSSSTSLIEPRQARSVATMHRILDAAESLMEGASFENIPVQTIMSRASVRPGSFYARFPDKLSLLGVLYERYATDVEALLDRELDGLKVLGGEERIRAMIRLVGRTYTARRGVARSVALHYWNSAEESPLLVGLAQRQARLMKRLSAAFAAAAAELGEGQPCRAALFALKMVMTSSREHYLFAHKVKTLQFTDGEFESRLSDMIIGYLRGVA